MAESASGADSLVDRIPSHPFGDLITQHLARRHGLSQAKLADAILQDPAVITDMCHGRRLTGPQARQRVIAIIRWLHKQQLLDRRRSGCDACRGRDASPFCCRAGRG